MNVGTTSVSHKDCTYELIVREIPTQKKVYIAFQTASDFSSIEKALSDLIPQLKILGAKEIFICCKDSSITLPKSEFLAAGMLFKYDHQMKKLLISPMSNALPQKTPDIILLPLTASLSDTYLKIYNDGFSTVPNFAFYTVEDTVRIMYDSKFEGGIVQVNGENAGVYELSYEETTPEVASVALAPAYRGKGYGKKAFRSALYKLEQKGFTEAFVLVSTRNIEALSLYTELGFKDENTLSVWYKHVVL